MPTDWFMLATAIYWSSFLFLILLLKQNSEAKKDSFPFTSPDFSVFGIGSDIIKCACLWTAIFTYAETKVDA